MKTRASRSRELDAVVVGSGPNGLAAAVTLAQEGCRVRVLEANERIGGGARTAELTLPGFRHDVCSAIHPLAAASPFFRGLQLESLGLDWIEPPVQLAHPLDDGTAASLVRSVEETAAGLGPDAPAYERLMGPLVEAADDLLDDVLRPLRWPRRPLLLARFGFTALRSAAGVCRRFRTPAARALFAGIAAHSAVPLERPTSAAIGLVLAVPGHTVGWPLPRGGAGQIAEALAQRLRSLGGQIETEHRVEDLDRLPAAGAVLLDLTPRQLLRLAGERLPALYRSQLRRYRYGPGVCKVDFALDGPIPWTAEACRRAATVHVGGTLEEIAEAEAAVWRGESPPRPFVLLAQPSLFDDSRAPAGKHTAWAYCHVPHASEVDVSERIEAQIERFAPGFRDRILARHTLLPADLERLNANLVGGDINGGAALPRQLIARPAIRWDPYATPVRGLYICSSSTPPGGGVHGMCGHLAALSALRREGLASRGRLVR